MGVIAFIGDGNTATARATIVTLENLFGTTEIARIMPNTPLASGR